MEKKKTARHVSQWAKTEDPHMRAGSYRHLILTDMSKIHSREKIASSNLVLEKLDVNM